MTAVMKRELKSYFSSPIGYVFLLVFFVFADFYFFATTLLNNAADISGVYSNMFTIVMFLVPILTMRLFSEDLKHKTDQLLLTAPISLFGLVMGKFLAAVVVYLIALSSTLVFGCVVMVFAMPNWGLIFGNFVALLLLGMAIIAIGMFISSMTENQVVAAVGTFAVTLALVLIDSLSSLFTNSVAIAVVDGISFMRRYSTFTGGIFELSGVVFFLSVCAIFIFLTVRVLDKRRWS